MKLQIIDEQKEIVTQAKEAVIKLPASDSRAALNELIKKAHEAIMVIENSWEEGRPFSFPILCRLQDTTARIKAILDKST
jgi:hypothetical protein